MKQVLLPIAEGSEDLETVTIYNLLIRAGIQVVLASVGDVKTQMARGITLIADSKLNDVQDQWFDMVVLPGGVKGAENLRESAELQRLLERHYSANKWIAAICAAPALVLAPHGLLQDKAATCYPGFDDHLPNYVEQSVVLDGNIITSRGPGTAIEFALTLIEQLAGSDSRKDVEKQILL